MVCVVIGSFVVTICEVDVVGGRVGLVGIVWPWVGLDVGIIVVDVGSSVVVVWWVVDVEDGLEDGKVVDSVGAIVVVFFLWWNNPFGLAFSVFLVWRFSPRDLPVWDIGFSIPIFLLIAFGKDLLN